MAHGRTAKTGVKVRYFAVIYNFAERQAHFAALDEMHSRDAFTTFFGSAPRDEDGDLAYLAFGIAEEEADAYVRRIAAARRRALKSGPADPVEG